MIIKAIFFDLDGTLRDFNTGRIPDSTKEALAKARDAGILLLLATGRHHIEIEEDQLLEDLNFDGYVTLNGQYCYCGPEVIYDNPISSDGVESMLDCIREQPFPCLFMEADSMYINMVNDVVIQAQEGIGSVLPPVKDVWDAGSRTIYQMVPYVNAEEEQRLKQRMPECDFVRWHDECGSDVMPKGGSKIVGIRKMLAYLGLSTEDAAAVGDGNNDVEMLRETGFGVAMGNGRDSAREAADYVTDSIEQDGLSKAVFYIIQNNIQEEKRDERGDLYS